MAYITQPYKPEGKVFCGDGREQELLRFVQNHPDFEFMQNNPSRVLDAIDEYGHKKDFLMNVGKNKGATISRIVQETTPETMVELGGYIGYSTIMFADVLRNTGGKKYISLEINQEFASVASSLVSIAGLADIVDIRVGPCASSLRMLQQENADFQIDLLFLDHQKSAYVRDLMLCETLSLVRSGSVIVADNVISPGAPLYQEYVRGSQFEKERLRGLLAKTDENLKALGNCSLVYTSKMLEGFEPTGERDGVEISLCH